MSSTPKQKLVFVTGNKNKLAEAQGILGNHFQLESVGIDLPELQGTSQEVAIGKCKQAAEIVNGPVFVEDTGLGFDALNGLPGPYIKWFLEGVGLDGLNKMLDGFSDRSASAFCTIAYSRGPGTEPILFDGRVQGKIVAARGPTKFGWDPVFQPDGYDKTYAEIEPAVKNTMSHRYKALVMLREFLDKENI
ncbi:nucleoside triphosphate pyrophosphohydrolase ham1 [Mortierella alpina]|nr:nucleoside triphosphate pyrophosphohydrolase ham1 [Mortierella alpina]